MVTGFPLLIAFIASVLLLLLMIIKWKMNPFFALLIAAICTGFFVMMPLPKIADTVTTGFGNTLKGIGIVIGLGIIFGNILSEARATESIAKGLLRFTGYDKAALAVTVAGFLISIPVFMDAAFVIMMPIVKFVAKETKKSLLIYVTALGVGTIVGHAMVIPTPGPLAVADNMHANVGGFLLYAIIAGFFAIACAGWLYGRRFDKYAAYEGDTGVEVPPYSNAPNGEANDETASAKVDITNTANLPSFGLSMYALLLPIFLILISNFLVAVLPKDNGLSIFFAFIGEKNIALILGCIAAWFMLRGYIEKTFNKIILEAADAAGLILLITGAGGAFGSVINGSGIGKYLVDTLAGMNISPVVLGFCLSALLRVSQGSTTVALVTTSSILGPAIMGVPGMSPVLVGLAICAGGIGFSLPNDSGFWVLSRFSGISVSDTLRTWTVGGSIASLVAFVVIYILELIHTSIGLPFC